MHFLFHEFSFAYIGVDENEQESYGEQRAAGQLRSRRAARSVTQTVTQQTRSMVSRGAEHGEPGCRAVSRGAKRGATRGFGSVGWTGVSRSGFSFNETAATALRNHGFVRSSFRIFIFAFRD